MYRLLKGYLPAHRAQTAWIHSKHRSQLRRLHGALSHASLLLLFVRLLVQWPTQFKSEKKKKSNKEPRGLCPRPGPYSNPQEALAGIFGIGEGFWPVQSLKKYISHTCMNMYRHTLTHTQVHLYAHTDTHSPNRFLQAEVLLLLFIWRTETSHYSKEEAGD